MPCVFCEIVGRRVAAEVIYENEFALAFLDHSPIVPGHTLVIPKRHFQNVIDVDENVLGEVIKAAKAAGQALMLRYQASGFNILCASGREAQQTVFHLHFHVIPRREADELNLWFGKGKDRKTRLE